MAKHNSLWSLIRAVLQQGEAIGLDHQNGNLGAFEHYSARLDEAAREREADFTELTAPLQGELIAMLRRYASECAECEGSGTVRSFTPRRDPEVMHGVGCPGCADIRAVIRKATGEA